MNRDIVVSSNCQTAGLATALAAMLPDDRVTPCPHVGDDASEQHLREKLRSAEIWVTATSPIECAAILGSNPLVRVVRVPRILFGAFHPDTIYMAGSDGTWLASPVARLHSALVVWGWRRGLLSGDIVALFSPQSMERLGYVSDWDAAVAALKSDVDDTDIDFAPFFLAISRGEPFMMTVNHPRFVVLVEIARQVARKLGAREDLSQVQWEQILPDALLATGPVWPVYPPVAESLGIHGAYVWRAVDGRLLGLEEFVTASLDSYKGLAPDEVFVPALDDPRFDESLEDVIAS